MSAVKGAGSARIKDQQARRVLDSAARQRRARKALESLEQDNSHEDPHADLVMSKKALSLFQVEKSSVIKRIVSPAVLRNRSFFSRRGAFGSPLALSVDSKHNGNDYRYIFGGLLEPGFWVKPE